MDDTRPFNREALVGRLFEQTIGAFELFNVYIGERLGLYRALAADGHATPADLAGRAGIDPRYAREWLEQQTTAGILEVDDPQPRRSAVTTPCLPSTENRCWTRTASATGRSCPATSCAVGSVMPALLDCVPDRRRCGLGSIRR